MTTFYTAYSKTINGTTFYFVKNYKTFPELQNVAPILETFGMHTNFTQACKIAMIFDVEIQQKLQNELGECNYPASTSYPAEIYNLRKKQFHFPSILKLIGLG
jgi:acyl-coenzyme A synthetase/AMP-(fatty) acid ligase